MYYLLKFSHLLFAISIIGIILFNAAFSLTLARAKSVVSLRDIKFTNNLDQLVFVLIGCQFIIGSFMVYPAGFSYHTPWISAAYVLLSITTICLIINFRLKKTLIHGKKLFKRKIFITMNAIIFLSLYLMIHDAISKQTYLNFFH